VTPLAFLALAALITLVGVLFIALSGRKRTPWRASIDDFRQHLDALAPPTDDAVGAADSDGSRGEGRTSAGT
jgi:hypothetical protein